LQARADLDALAALLDDELAQGRSLPQNLRNMRAVQSASCGRNELSRR
jgi:hypothetical protein